MGRSAALRLWRSCVLVRRRCTALGRRTSSVLVRRRCTVLCWRTSGILVRGRRSAALGRRRSRILTRHWFLARLRRRPRRLRRSRMSSVMSYAWITRRRLALARRGMRYVGIRVSMRGGLSLVTGRRPRYLFWRLRRSGMSVIRNRRIVGMRRGGVVIRSRRVVSRRRMRDVCICIIRPLRSIVVVRPRCIVVRRSLRSGGRHVYRGITRSFHTGTAQSCRFGSCSNLRASVVHGSQLSAISARRLLMLRLG